jgi:transposase
MTLPLLPGDPVTHLGIDDFAFRRGRTYGTVLVDLRLHKVIDLLPDRKAETAKAWMQARPEIELVSRDRGGDYAAAARQGAPQAIQTADRFHLCKNLTEAVEKALARCRAEIRKSQKAVWLFVRPFEDLSEEEQEELLAMRQVSATAEAMYHLVQEFFRLMHFRQGSRLDSWLRRVKASAIQELQGFARGLERDKAAVLARLTLVHSNGQVEGQVTRIKLIKRMMFGRAALLCCVSAFCMRCKDQPSLEEASPTDALTSSASSRS